MCAYMYGGLYRVSVTDTLHERGLYNQAMKKIWCQSFIVASMEGIITYLKAVVMTV